MFLKALCYVDMYISPHFVSNVNNLYGGHCSHCSVQCAIGTRKPNDCMLCGGFSVTQHCTRCVKSVDLVVLCVSLCASLGRANECPGE